MTEKIIEIIDKNSKEIIELREYLHENPELDLDLFNTQKTIKEKLDKLGIEYVEMAKTGICAIIRGTKGNVNGTNRKTVLLRGDMDALKIKEEADVPYKSKKEGVMHACGHDGHTAGLFGALIALNELKDEIDGNIKFAFQPAEELSGGAEKMIAEGILENPKVDMAFALHVQGGLPEGIASMKVGPMMASPDDFMITIKGKGGHASKPENAIDPVIIVGEILIGIQTIRSRMISTFKPLVISCTMLKAGDATNVIPSEASIGGTVRTLNLDVREEAPKLIERMVDGITKAHGATYEFEYNKYYPILINDEKASEILINSAKKILGEESYRDMEIPSMGAEDFAYFGYEVPSAYINVGIAQEGKENPIHHHPLFEFRSEIVQQLSKILAQVAVDSLKKLNENK